MKSDEHRYWKGRGSVINPANRFHTQYEERFSDGWDRQEEEEAAPATEYLEDNSRTIIARNQSPDLAFNQSVNPYRGCEHGCVYCYARPTHAYLDFSPGLDFETKILVKRKAPELLRQAFEKKSYVCQTLALGTNTDPYQPVERELCITRSILELCLTCRHPVSLVTKSSLILRDLDLLQALAGRNLCSVAISVTTLDNDLKRRLEPRTAAPESRLRNIRELAKAGVPVSVLAAPVIPCINDQELEEILGRSRDAGAGGAGYVFLRLPLEVAPIFQTWLKEHFPQRAEHVMSIVRQSRGGKDYQSGFGRRMRGQGPFADLLQQRFNLARRRLGLGLQDARPLDTGQFRPPAESGLEGQLPLI